MVWEIVGQAKVISLLQRSLEKDAVAHAYLLIGPPHVGKMTMALDLAKALNCEASEPPCGECASCQKIASGKHADVQVIALGSNGTPVENKPQAEISIDQIRQMQHSASLPPFAGRYKVFIVDEAELLSNEAANCLLKTLEEPVAKMLFMLLTKNERLLPSTVISRCQRLELAPLTVTEVETALTNRWGVEREQAELLARLCHGCLGWALSAIQDSSLLHQRSDRLKKLINAIDADYEERFDYAFQLATQFSQNRGDFQKILGLWLDWWRDLLLAKIDHSDLATNVDMLEALANRAREYTLSQIRDAISSIQAVGEQLKQNANPKLALEVLMLNIPAKEVVKHG